jgi:hypothetical protein
VRRNWYLRSVERTLRVGIATLAWDWQQQIFVGVIPSPEEKRVRWHEYFRRDMVQTRRLKPQRARYPSDGRRR